ncbi:MAG: toprim domain-containing protein [Hyphomicrobium sp.]
MAHGIANELAANAETIAGALLGDPTFKSRHEQRWGKRGSLAVCIAGERRGLWYDYERGEGGDLVALIARERAVDRARAYEIAQTEFLSLEVRPKNPKHTASPSINSAPNHSNEKIAVRLWRESTRICGSLGSTYLRSRSIEVEACDLNHVLRWHQKSSALIALMTDAITSEPCGVHRTFLDANARKISRKMLGRQGVLRISVNEEVLDGLGICEGLEDGLSILQSGWRPIWSVTSAGGISRFPVIKGVESLTIFADRDQAGCLSAANCAQRWRQARLGVTIYHPGASANV